MTLTLPPAKGGNCPLLATLLSATHSACCLSSSHCPSPSGPWFSHRAHLIRLLASRVPRSIPPRRARKRRSFLHSQEASTLGFTNSTTCEFSTPAGCCSKVGNPVVKVTACSPISAEEEGLVPTPLMMYS